MSSRLPQVKKEDVPNLVFHKNSRFNQNTYDGICKFCFEVVIFRHVLFDGKNAIICTRCLNSVAMIKGHELRNNILSHYTRYVLIIRTYNRLKAWVTGGKKPYPFRRKKNLLQYLRLTK